MKVCICSLLIASGILKGYDALLNLVLDNTTEYLRGMYAYMCIDFCLFAMIESKGHNFKTT